MKKSVLIALFLILLIIPVAFAFSLGNKEVFSLNKVFNDFFGKLSGSVVATNTCSDSDDGKIYNIKGTVTGRNNLGIYSKVDRCVNNNTLYEFYCSNTNSVRETYTCPNGCSNGACIQTTSNLSELITQKVWCTFKNSTITEKCYSDYGSCEGVKQCSINVTGNKGNMMVWYSSCGDTYKDVPLDYYSDELVFDCSHPPISVNITNCVDSDHGKNFSIKGKISWLENGIKRETEDFCGTETKMLGEWYCSNNDPYVINYNCPNGCENGACLSTTNETINATCTDSDASPDYIPLTPIGIAKNPDFFIKGKLIDFSSKGIIYGLEPNPDQPKFTNDTYSTILDYCKDNYILIEGYCNVKGSGIVDAICSNGCRDGACIQQTTNETLPQGCVRSELNCKSSASLGVLKSEDALNSLGNLSSANNPLFKDLIFSDDEGVNTGDHSYKQTLSFTPYSGKFVYEQDRSGCRFNDPLDYYLKFSSNELQWAWTYQLEMIGSAVKIKDAADLESNVISILGKDWVITDAVMRNSSYGAIDKLTLIAGNILQTIIQGYTVGGVTIIDVDQAETKCVVEYAGKTYIIDKGQTKIMEDGTVVGVTDAISGVSQSMCELAIGAYKLELENGKKALLNGLPIDISYIFISGNETQNIAGLKYITISYQPEDTMWLAQEENLYDPVFNSFGFNFKLDGNNDANVYFKYNCNANKTIFPTCLLSESDCPLICAECPMGYSGGGCVGGVDKITCTCKKPAPCEPNYPPAKCDGCFVEDKCLPYGTRYNKMYCDIEGNLILQKGDNNYCQNNYECRTNVCVNDKCISSSLINRIIAWFTRWFSR